VTAASDILCVETVVNPLQLYHDISDTPASLDEIKLLLTIRSEYLHREYLSHTITLHRMYEMLTILTDVHSVCLSVCLSVTRLRSCFVGIVLRACVADVNL